MNIVRFICWICTLLCMVDVSAQAPQKMSYQSVVRNAAGNLVTSSPVGVRISILQDSVSGVAAYVETHSAFTNGNGLVTLEIGGGSIQNGNFGTIDWGSGAHFVTIEVDPSGGTNYTISSTSQLLSVPYALYAEKTKPQGRTSIYLTGDITNEEAAAKIAMEAGPNTENIYIVGTRVLTTVSISGLTSLANLRISSNSVLQSVTINGATAINDSFQVSGNSLTTLLLPDLETISGPFFISTPLLSITMPALTQIWAGTNTNAPQIFAVNLTCPLLANIAGEVNLNVTNINLPALEHADHLRVSLGGQSNLELNLNNLSTGYLEVFNTQLNNLNLPNFTSGTLNIHNNPQLTTVSLPSLTTFRSDNGGIGSTIKHNPNLTSISFPLLSNLDSSVAPFPGLFLSYNALSGSNVNSILHQMLNVTPLKGIDLRQTVPAPPTGQGIIDKQTLIAQGNNILTD